MKDAKGHGSNPRGVHSAKVNQIGRPVAINPNILAKIRANPNGFSIKLNGSEPKDGYMVSKPGHTQIVSEADLSGDRAHQILSDYARANSAALMARGAHIGGWTDESTKKTYLDVSHNIRNRATATQAGRARNQISIWDVKRKRTIDTGGTGE